MPIVSGDIDFFLSGGSGNTDPDASLGGVKSSEPVPSDLFDNVSSAEALAGDTEYRAYYIHNSHATLTMLSPKVWVQANTSSADTTVEIGAGTAAVNANEQTVANEATAPTGVTFSAAANEGAAITLADIPAGQHKAVWVKRIVNSTAGAASDTFTLRAKCDTLP